MKAYKYLTLKDRELFEREYSAGARLAEIAEQLGIHTATAYSELARGYVYDDGGAPVLDKNGRRAYNARIAQQRLQEGLHRRGKRPAKRSKEKRSPARSAASKGGKR